VGTTHRLQSRHRARRLIQAFAALVTVILIEAWVLFRVVIRLGGFRQLLGTPPREFASARVAKLGERIKLFRFVEMDGGALRGERWQAALADCVLLLLPPCSVSAYRVSGVLNDWLRAHACPLSWYWIFASDRINSQRFIDQLQVAGRSFRLHPKLLHKRQTQYMPVAIYLDKEGCPAHIAGIYDNNSLADFVSSCPNRDLRGWLQQFAKSDTPETRRERVSEAIDDGTDGIAIVGRGSSSVRDPARTQSLSSVPKPASPGC
jgi:hypothetical protein